MCIEIPTSCYICNNLQQFPFITHNENDEKIDLCSKKCWQYFQVRKAKKLKRVTFGPVVKYDLNPKIEEKNG